MKLNNKEKKINDVLDWFDFGRVLKVMQHLDWKWASTDGVPEYEGQLRENARRLCYESIDLAEKNDYRTTIGTGGFYATYEPDIERLTLEFQLDRVSSDYD